MGILRKPTKDSFTAALERTNERFHSRGVNLFGNGHEDVLNESAYFAEYTHDLLEGLSEDDAETLGIVMQNSRLQLLTESLSGTTPISSLSLPMLRKAYPRMVIPNTIPTQAAETPKFTTPYIRPYIMAKDGTKRFLPELFYAQDEEYAGRPKLFNDFFPVGATKNLMTTVGITTANGDSVDVDVMVQAVKMKVKNSAGAAEETVTVDKVNIKMDSRTNLISGVVSGKHSTGYVTKDTVFVVIDRITGDATPTSLQGLVTEVKVEAYVSSEYNNSNEQVGYDITTKETNIPTGGHISAPMSSEYLTDQLKMFNVDGIAKVVDIMSTVLGTRVDTEGLTFLDSTKVAGQWERQFDMYPPNTFAGVPSDWRREIRPVIDNIAQEMINAMQVGSYGYFVLVGNPIDTMILPDVDWVFDHTASEQAGVRVDYSVGEARGVYRYIIVSSERILPGKLRIVWIPMEEDAKTYMFYPYSFTMSKGEGNLNVRTPNVPAIVAHRRYVFENFMESAIGEIRIIHNNGTFQY
jgi:hypothetical protein